MDKASSVTSSLNLQESLAIDNRSSRIMQAGSTHPGAQSIAQRSGSTQALAPDTDCIAQRSQTTRQCTSRDTVTDVAQAHVLGSCQRPQPPDVQQPECSILGSAVTDQDPTQKEAQVAATHRPLHGTLDSPWPSTLLPPGWQALPAVVEVVAERIQQATNHLLVEHAQSEQELRKMLHRAEADVVHARIAQEKAHAQSVVARQENDYLCSRLDGEVEMVRQHV
jgi:hypothetical protein